MTSKVSGKDLIHIAKIFTDKGQHCYVLLRKVGPHEYQWFLKSETNQEIPCDIIAPSSQEAMRLARKKWERDDFSTLNCGFIYSLPERDEHGMNALFCEMTASLNSSSGIYFDEGRGYNCFVQNASEEAIEFLRRHISLQ